MGSGSPDAKGRRVAAVVLAVYVAVLAVLTLWPTSVASPLLRPVQGFGPVQALVTYGRAEFLANIALFAPLGLLLSLILPSRLRYAVMPVGFLASVVIEGVQAVALPDRVPSVTDIVANTAGTCVGLLVVVILELQAERASRSPS